jgi:type II secretory pathway pseudopilin PulG
MSTLSRKRGITLVEVLTVIGVLCIVICILLAVIPKWRENARRANCTNNMKQIGLGLLSYESQQKHLPGSAEVIKSDAIRPVGGWSFLFKIFPHMEYDPIYNSIDPRDHKGTVEIVEPNTTIIAPGVDMGQGNAIGIACGTGIGEFLCPSNPNQSCENPNPESRPIGLLHPVTNYKAMCSVFYPGFATNTGTTQQYTGAITVPAGSYPGLYQCDGGLYPTNDGIRLSEITDGVSHTILCGETQDFMASCWIAGSDVNMVAIPDAAPQIPTGVVPVLFSDKSGSPYFALPGFNGKYDEPSGTRGIVTFFALEYGSLPTGPSTGMGGGPTTPCKDAGTYALDPTLIPCQMGYHPRFNKMEIYGPSSAHPSVINCLFGDGSVRGVRKDVDASALFFVVTRNNNDPPADDHL